MKSSRFNVFLEYGKVILGYNTLYETYVVVDKELYSLISGYLQTDIEEIGAMHPVLYKTLIAEKFIIDNAIDEIDEVAKILHEENENNYVFGIVINPTMNCNFKCWYCYENHAEGSKMDSMEQSNIVRFVEKMLAENKDLKLLKIQWFGGEPLLCFESVVKPLLTEINILAKARNVKINSGFTSNGYLITDSMLDFCVENSVQHFQITIDGHKERHNVVRFTYPGSNTYDKVIGNIIKCVKKGLYVTVRINVSSNTNAHVESVLQDFILLTPKERELIRFSIHKVWQENGEVITDVDKIVAKIRELGFVSASFYSNPNSIRNSCYADKKNSVVFNYNGDVFKCTARDYAKNKREGVLMDEGDIKWNDNHQLRNIASVLNYQTCLNCLILPICNAGCSQNKIENKEHYCPCQFDYSQKIDFAKRVLMDKIYFSQIKQKNSTY